MNRKPQSHYNYIFSIKVLFLGMLATFVAWGNKSIVSEFVKAESLSSQNQIYAKIVSDIGDVKNK